MANLPTHQNLRITELSGLFEKTTNSYKFYWFWSLLEQVQTQNTLSFKDLVMEMVVLSWHTVAYYKLSLGAKDQLPEIIQRILALGVVNELSKREEVRVYLNDCWTTKTPSVAQKELVKELKKLQHYVPYRLLSPFFDNLPSGNTERIIAERSRTIFAVAEEAALYKINPDKHSNKKENSLTIHPAWQSYLQQHHKILREFCWWNLSQFLRSRNPNVPSVSGKILPPYTYKRDLKSAKTFWKKVILTPELPPLRCLYTQAPLQPKWSIDHFVPWSFVLHDQFWNLLPTPNAINSSKNNRLPHQDYWEPFARLHYQAFQRFFAHEPNSDKHLDDYAILYKTTTANIANFLEEKFVEGLLDSLQPLMQQAKNLGFAGGWKAG